MQSERHSPLEHQDHECEIDYGIVDASRHNYIVSRDDFYSLYVSLSQTLSKVPNRELLIILGDFNAKTGETKADSHLRSVVGQYGTRRISYQSLTPTFNTMSGDCPHTRRTYTGQIDYLLIKSRWKSSIRDIKSYPGLDCGSDHNALVVELSLKLRKDRQQATKPILWNIGNNPTLKDNIEGALTTITQKEQSAWMLITSG
ncbi:hypothetical protein HUJ05_001862 [Dendroctonus ponderosae]|nr:hypothetical protein HUJ05_001862 [Dendroctonus ponderosae]